MFCSALSPRIQDTQMTKNPHGVSSNPSGCTSRPIRTEDSHDIAQRDRKHVRRLAYVSHVVLERTNGMLFLTMWSTWNCDFLVHLFFWSAKERTDGWGKRSGCWECGNARLMASVISRFSFCWMDGGGMDGWSVCLCD